MNFRLWKHFSVSKNLKKSQVWVLKWWSYIKGILVWKPDDTILTWYSGCCPSSQIVHPRPEDVVSWPESTRLLSPRLSQLTLKHKRVHLSSNVLISERIFLWQHHHQIEKGHFPFDRVDRVIHMTLIDQSLTSLSNYLISSIFTFTLHAYSSGEISCQFDQSIKLESPSAAIPHRLEPEPRRSKTVGFFEANSVSFTSRNWTATRTVVLRHPHIPNSCLVGRSVAWTLLFLNGENNTVNNCSKFVHTTDDIESASFDVRKQINFLPRISVRLHFFNHDLVLEIRYGVKVSATWACLTKMSWYPLSTLKWKEGVSSFRRLNHFSLVLRNSGYRKHSPSHKSPCQQTVTNPFRQFVVHGGFGDERIALKQLLIVRMEDYLPLQYRFTYLAIFRPGYQRDGNWIKPHLWTKRYHSVYSPDHRYLEHSHGFGWMSVISSEFT